MESRIPPNKAPPPPPHSEISLLGETNSLYENLNLDRLATVNIVTLEGMFTVGD